MTKFLRFLLLALVLIGTGKAMAQPSAPALMPADSSAAVTLKRLTPQASLLWRLFVDSNNNQRLASTDFGTFPKMEPSRLRSLNVNGFYRFFGTYRNMPAPYAFLPSSNLPLREVFIGDDTQLPNMLININGKSRSGVSWGLDLFAFQFLDRPGLAAYSQPTADTARPGLDNPLGSPRLGQSLLLNLGINLHATVPTALGPLAIKLGGIHWEDMTDLTMGAYTAYERYMLFDRNPWDPIGSSVHQRYNRYVDAGRVDQEERWGKRAFTGAVLSMSQLPKNQSAKLMFGKNEQNGGFDLRPNAAWGGQYQWLMNTHWRLSAQTMNQRSYTDSLLTQRFGSQIHTIKISRLQKAFNFDVEAGYSGYQSTPLGQQGGLVAQSKVRWQINKSLRLFGQAYYIDPGAVNNVGAFVNTSVAEASISNIPAGQAGSGALLFPSGSSLLGFGQLANNRQGIDLNIGFQPANVYFSGGYSLSREITTGATNISFGRPVNALTRSRFYRWGFPQQVGPYGRTNVLYRSTYERFDFRTPINEALYFSQLELQALYRLRLGEKVLVFNHLLRAASVQTQAAVIKTAPQAILRQYATENELYLQWNSRISVVMMLSGDISLGGIVTPQNVLGRPFEQYGAARGIGIDIWAADNVCVYLRHKYFAFEDRSYEYDKYRGTESTIELKLLF
jgi:hypothetical protein